MNKVTLFFYDNNEYLLTDFLDEAKFRFEGIEIEQKTFSSFLEILSDCDHITSCIINTIDFIEKECKEKELYNLIIRLQDYLSSINKIFKIFSIELEILDYISDRQKSRKVLTNNPLHIKEYIIDYLKIYYLKIKNIKNSIDAYYNINNDKLLSKLPPSKRVFYLKSMEIELLKSLIIPKAKQFVCIEYKNLLLPAESFIYKTSEINNLDISEIKNQYFDKSNDNKIYKYILNHKVYNVTVYELTNLWDFLNAYFYYLTTNNIHINKCKNCNKYFIPTKKSNETLCDNIYKNRQNL